LRKTLFNSIIRKDIAFFDSYRTGEILSRISSDTAVVQEGLTTSCTVVVGAVAKILITIVILFMYQPYICVILVVCILPSILTTRWALGFMNKSAAAG